MDTINPAITAEDLLRHSAWLHRLAARLVDPSSTDDVVQDTWVAAMRSPPQRDREVRPWLAQVMRNLARNRARSARRWHSRAEKVRAIDDRALPSAEELATTHEAQRLVAEMVAGLVEPFRSTLLLCYGEGLAPSEIARRQGVPAGTVRWRLKRGLDDIRAGLDTRYGHDRKAWTAALGPLAGRATTMVVGGARRLAPSFMVLAAGTTIAAALALLLISPPGRAPVAGERAEPRLARAPAAPATPARLRLAPTRTAAPPTAPGEPPPTSPRPPASVMAAVAAPLDPAVQRAIEVGHSPTKGKPDAPVTMVLFTDYQCQFCARLVPTLSTLLAAYPQEVRLVVKNLPLPFHEAAALAAEAAMAANEQGKFWEMHDRLYANQDKLDPKALEEHARAIGLDVGKFKAALESGKFRKEVEAEAKLVTAAGITGTPAVFINGAPLVGAQPVDAFRKKIDEELARITGKPTPARPALAVRPAQEARPPSGPPQMIVNGRYGASWPPPRITLPDDVLGARVTVPFVTGNAPWRGSGKAVVQIVYLTFAGGSPGGKIIVDGLLQSYGADVRVVAVPLQGMPMVKDGPPLAEALWEAHAQGKFWELHDALIPAAGRREVVDRAALDAIAGEIGLDKGNLAAALDSGVYKARVEEDGRMAREAHVGPLPAFIVDGRAAAGTVALVQLVEAALKKKGRAPAPRATAAVETNPAAPGYDARQLLASLTVPQLFVLEPRDAEWAAVVEKELTPIVLSDASVVDPAARGVSFECHATICRLRAQATRQGHTPLFRYVAGVYKLRDMVLRSDGADWYFDLRGQPPTKSAAEAAASFKSRRASMLNNFRTGRAALGPDLSVERLPRE
jgi:RNA polymerase sigma factor (sigma-70 family)